MSRARSSGRDSSERVDAPGAEQEVCCFHSPGDNFSETAEDSSISTLSCAHVERLLMSNPQVAMRILETMGKRVVEAERQLEDLAFKGLAPRIAALLLREAASGEVIGLSHQDLA